MAVEVQFVYLFNWLDPWVKLRERNMSLETSLQVSLEVSLCAVCMCMHLCLHIWLSRCGNALCKTCVCVFAGQIQLHVCGFVSCRHSFCWSAEVPANVYS